MSEPVAYMRVNTWVTPDSPNGPAEYDQEIELIPSGELSDYAGWIPLYAAPLQQEADKDGERLREFLDENMTFMEVKHDHPTAGPNIPVLASVSKRIWYHATDDTESWPFSKVIDAALPSDDKVKP